MRVIELIQYMLCIKHEYGVTIPRVISSSIKTEGIITYDLHIIVFETVPRSPSISLLLGFIVVPFSPPP